MNLTHDAVLIKRSNFMNTGLSSVHTLDELGSVFIPTTKIGTPMDGSNLLPPGHRTGEVSADIVRRTRSEKTIMLKLILKLGDKINILGAKNSMSLPPLDSTPLGTNKNNRTTSPIDLIQVVTKTPEPTPLTKPTDFLEQYGKAHVPVEPDPYPSSSDSPGNKYNYVK